MKEDAIFEHEVALPSHGNADNIVHWHAFRRIEQAREFLPSIRLDAGQRLVGGQTADSLGPLWWVGVRVDDHERWGNRQAVNKHAVSD
ncbi:hypothetical protein [Acidihalobacter ferrooxydans]|uniref:Uncharacterized protein n=1 Tax=Acidihalobacter ferrooxydans TaxID=1765967 RepID=A0A1P8UG16_9GAMM|nr:hypothetical protein [Acidihalobacter ferrooxydans]APZ42760.1 hypothetical protein BW247_06350 [Acidihalobacter ferrooxydans]